MCSQDPDPVARLLDGAARLFDEVHEDSEPYEEPRQLVHLLFFRRFTEVQAEHCRAIRTLYSASYFRAAVSILRSLFEVSVAQVLLKREGLDGLMELLKGEHIRTHPALQKIGWPNSQGDLYARLSRIAHPTRTSAFLGRTLDFESEPLKSLIERRHLQGIAAHILWTGGLETGDSAQRERWAFVAP